jgi:HKD family nuclease
MFVRIHFLELVENESHICHQNLVRELTNGHALSSSIGFRRPVGCESQFMPVRKHRNQGVRGVIGGDHDEAATRQTLSQNCVDGRHDT